MLSKLTVESFHNICKSNNYAIHLKIIWCSVSLHLSKTGKKRTVDTSSECDCYMYLKLIMSLRRS